MSKHNLEQILGNYEENIPESIETMIQHTLENLPEKKVEKVKKTWWKKRLITVGTSVVLTAGMIAGGMYYSSPAFAQWVKSVFSFGDDTGLKRVSEAGLTKQQEIIIKDQGLSIVLNELYADEFRVSFSYYVKDQNGKVLDPDLQLTGDAVYVTDEHGKKIRSGNFDWTRVNRQGRPYGLVTIGLVGENVPQKLQLHFHITKVNGKEGTWKHTALLDRSQTADLAKKIPGSKKVFTAPDGTRVQLDRLELVPSMSRVLVKTLETGKSGHTRLEYEIKDDSGKVVGIIHGKGSNAIWMAVRPGASPGELVHDVTFKPFPESTRYTFYLKRLVRDKFLKHILLINNPKEPSVFNINGDQLVIKDMHNVKEGTKFKVEYTSNVETRHIGVTVPEKSNPVQYSYRHHKMQKTKDGNYFYQVEITINGAVLDLSKPVELRLDRMTQIMNVDWTSVFAK